MNFNFNISNWLSRNLPLERRGPITFGYLNALLTPVQSLADVFAQKCTQLDFRIKYSSEQMVLASLLNKLFDAVDKRIRIETISDLVPPVILWFDDESTEGPVLYFDDESTDGPILKFDDEINPYSFRVIVPAALAAKEDEIKSWVNLYKQIEKTFTIIFI